MGLGARTGAGDALIAFKGADATHPYCTATWPRTISPEQRQDFEARQQEWVERLMESKIKGEKMNEPSPVLAEQNSIMLTVAGVEFDNDAAAVAALESLVGQLTGGIEVETESGTASFRLKYDEWLDGVGDRAAWGNANCKLSVAAKSRMFHLDVRMDEWAGTRPPESEQDAVVAVNQPIAIELAQGVIARL